MILELRYLDDPCKSLMALLEMTQHRLDVALGALLFIERTVGNPNHHTSGLTSLPDSQGDMCLTSIYTWLAERARGLCQTYALAHVHMQALYAAYAVSDPHTDPDAAIRVIFNWLATAYAAAFITIDAVACGRLWSPAVACLRRTRSGRPPMRAMTIAPSWLRCCASPGCAAPCHMACPISPSVCPDK